MTDASAAASEPQAAQREIAPAGERSLKQAELSPVPQAPAPGILNAVRYALAFTRARWERRSAIRSLQRDIEDNTAALDELLGALGRRARELRVDNRALAAENAALDEAERRRDEVEQTRAALRDRQAEENHAFAQLESEQQGRVNAAEADLARAQGELTSLEAQRRGLREQRKAIERQQKSSLKSAEDREVQAAKATADAARDELRRAAEAMRTDAAALDPQRNELDQRLAELERPIAETTAKVHSLEAGLDAARRSLHETREGHRQHLAELDAEQGRRNRELSQAEAEIQRRMVALGTLLNLHRVPRPEFDELYARIDRLRSAIGVRTTEIEHLSAERDAYDRTSLIRGYSALGAGAVGLIVLIAILAAIF